MASRSALDALLSHHRAAVALRTEARNDAALGARRSALRTWQCARLAATYADLVRTPRYRAATTFFLSDLYSTTDPSTRDAELERALPKLARLLPRGALEPLELALESDAIAERLDRRLADTLHAAGDSTGTLITVTAYATAYRACANPVDRAQQIDLVDCVGHALDRIAHAPMLAGAVHMMRGPARAAGLGTLQSFLERGLDAFKSLGDASEFLAIVKRRETELMNDLFAGDSTGLERIIAAEA
jgi:hypothetical protein